MTWQPDPLAANRAAEYLDELEEILGEDSMPPALVWVGGQEPEAFGEWDLYSTDDVEYVAAIPPGASHSWSESPEFGCADVEIVELPNGWELRVGYG